MIRVNLLPEVQKAKSPKAKVRREIPLTWIIAGLVVVLITCVGLGVFHMSLQRKADRVQADIQRLQEDIKRLKLDVQKVEQVKNQRNELNNKLAVIEKLKSNQRGPVHLLDQIASCIPQNVWLTELSENGQSMNINGMSMDHIQISRFMQNLEKSPFFSNVNLSKTETSAGGKSKAPGSSVILKTFNLTCRIDTPKEFL